MRYLLISLYATLLSCEPSKVNDPTTILPYLSAASPIQIGSVPLDSKLWLTLPLQNVADEDIVVFDVTTSCGCLATNFKPTRLHPGEKMSVEITLTSRQKAGPIRERIKFFSSSEALNSEEITLEGSAVVGPSMSEAIELGTVRPEIGAEVMTILRNVPASWVQSPDQLVALADKISIPLEFNFRRVDGESIEMECVLQPCSVRGFFSTNLRIYLPTTNQNIQGIYLESRLTGAGIPVIWAEPGELLGSNLLTSAEFRLQWLDGYDFSLPKRTYSGHGYSWELHEIDEEQRSALLRLSVSSRSEIEKENGIRIPFATAGNTFDLFLPYYPAR